jgi:hypothetical protein
VAGGDTVGGILGQDIIFGVSCLSLPAGREERAVE